jgi:hypothetical protein
MDVLGYDNKVQMFRHLVDSLRRILQHESSVKTPLFLFLFVFWGILPVEDPTIVLRSHVPMERFFE